MHQTKALLAIPLLSACALSMEEPPPGGDPGGKEDHAGGEAHPPELRDSYKLFLRSVTQVQDQTTGEVTVLDTRAGALARVEQEESGVSLSLTPCWIKLPELNGYKPTINAAVFQVLQPIEMEGALVPGEEGFELVAEPAAFLLGAALADPIADPMPTQSTSPAVIDQDRDGNPGVSVYVAGYQVFAAARLIFSMDAPLSDGVDAIDGRSNVELDTEIYGDTIPLFDARRAHREAEQGKTPIGSDHVFSLRPFNSSPSCANVPRF